MKIHQIRNTILAGTIAASSLSAYKFATKQASIETYREIPVCYRYAKSGELYDMITLYKQKVENGIEKQPLFFQDKYWKQKLSQIYNEIDSVVEKLDSIRQRKEYLMFSEKLKREKISTFEDFLKKEATDEEKFKQQYSIKEPYDSFTIPYPDTTAKLNDVIYKLKLETEDIAKGTNPIIVKYVDKEHIRTNYVGRFRPIEIEYYTEKEPDFVQKYWDSSIYSFINKGDNSRKLNVRVYSTEQ